MSSRPRAGNNRPGVAVGKDDFGDTRSTRLSCRNCKCSCTVRDSGSYLDNPPLFSFLFHCVTIKSRHIIPMANQHEKARTVRPKVFFARQANAPRCLWGARAARKENCLTWLVPASTILTGLVCETGHPVVLRLWDVLKKWRAAPMSLGQKERETLSAGQSLIRTTHDYS